MKVMLSGCPCHHSMACPQAAAGERERERERDMFERYILATPASRGATMSLESHHIKKKIFYFIGACLLPKLPPTAQFPKLA